jgi:hypothetical protein
MSNEINNAQDVLNSRDIFKRIEELEDIRDSLLENNVLAEWEESDEYIEFTQLTDFIKGFRGYGGEVEWRGYWYPTTLINDIYFVDYINQFLEDCGDIPQDFPAWIVIDWEKTAENIKQNYVSSEFDGVTYWAR